MAPPSLVMYVGHTIRDDGSGFFEVPNIGGFNYSQFSHLPWDYVYLNLSNKIGINKEVTLSSDAYVGLLEQLNATGSWNTINTSTFYNEWNATNISTVTRGITFNFLNAENRQFRILVSNAAKDDGTYSWFLNTSILGTMYVLEFDPLLGGVNVAAQSRGSVAIALSPCCFGAGPVTNLNNENFADNVQTGENNQNTISFVINLSQGQAVNGSTIFAASADYDATDFNISGNSNATGIFTGVELGNMTWVLLKSVLGNQDRNITVNWTNNVSYNRYKLDISKWNNGVISDANGIALGEWELFNTTIVAADSFPTLQQNSSNVSTFRKGDVVQFAFNLSESSGLFVEHNMTSDGAAVNITIANTGVINASANVTMIFGNTTNFYVKLYFNDSANQMNNTVPRTFYTTSNTASVIPVIGTPTAGSYNTTSTITWAAVGDVDNNTITYRVYVNDTFNGSTTATGLSLNMTSEKTYAINVSAFDSTDDSGNSTQVQFVFDNIPPRVDNGTNINPSGFRNVNWAFINYTWTEPFNNSQLIRNGTGGVVTNTTANLNLTYFWYNFTGLQDANYSFSAWINDSAGQVNTTTNTSITIDATFPTITFAATSEANNSFVSKNWLAFNISLAETNPATLNISLKNGTNLAASFNFSYNTTPLFNIVNFTGLADDQYNISVRAADRATNTNDSTNRTVTVDTTTPIIENGSISPASAVVGNPFTITAYYSDLWLSNVTATIAGTNYTMNCGSTSCAFTFTNTTIQGTYNTDRFYATDKAGNTATNITSLSFTAAAAGGISAGEGGGGGGGGGGGLVIVEKDTGLVIIINGTLTATPPAINTYANYFTSGDKPKTWSKSVRTNSILDRCLITPPFSCALNLEDKTGATISLTYTQTGFAKTFATQLTLANSAENAVTVPVKITSFNLGASVPAKFKIGEGLKWLTPSIFFNHLPDGTAQLRWVSIVLLLFLPTLSLPNVTKSLVARKNKVVT